MNKAYIETYGCQMNVNDTEVIFAILRDAGYERTESMEEAGLIMANTCSIRDNAEQRIWGRLEVFNQQKKARPGVLVGIVGCMAERLKDKLLDTGKVDLEPEKKDHKVSGISYDNLAMPEVHFKKK